MNPTGKDSTFYIFSRCTSKYVYEFNTFTESFIESTSRPPLSRCAFTKYKNCIYAFGGYRNELLCDVGLIYDTSEKTWKEFHSPIGKAFCEVCTVGDQMYLIGGLNSDSELVNTCSCYSYLQGSWIDLPNMKQFRGASAVAFYNSSLFVMGGFSASCNQEVERYDPREGKWATAGKVNIFGVLSSAVVESEIHLLNSYSGKYCKYDPRNLTCTEESMIPFLGKNWLESMNNRLHVIHLDGIDIYNKEREECTRILSYNFEKCPCLVC